MNKKGISVVIGYVLLIVVAISLSLLIYAWLKAQVPKETEECPESLALVISNYNCTSNQITLSIKNQGYFNVDGFFARVKDESGVVHNLIEIGSNNQIETYFGVGEINIEPLKPGESQDKVFSYEDIGKIVEIEIEPFIFEEEVILCSNAIINQNLENCEIIS